MSVSWPLRALKGADGMPKVRAHCLTCERHDGELLSAWLDWEILVYRLKIMELQGTHTAEMAV
ncbi:MAG: hypothetical protein ACR2I4_05345 [Actinomycetota bacterium]